MRFYNAHKELINETIQMQRKRMQEREERIKNEEANRALTLAKKTEDILALSEDASTRHRKRESKKKARSRRTSKNLKVWMPLNCPSLLKMKNARKMIWAR